MKIGFEREGLGSLVCVCLCVRECAPACVRGCRRRGRWRRFPRDSDTAADGPCVAAATGWRRRRPAMSRSRTRPRPGESRGVRRCVCACKFRSGPLAFSLDRRRGARGARPAPPPDTEIPGTARLPEPCCAATPLPATAPRRRGAVLAAPSQTRDAVARGSRLL